ncbi:hypothetical protein BD410DRAFT_826474 [Rickenella mellea]|uniref:Uncharacterized protein n=1 Tax=Rickenella mellea TaxID=50990 RepID=A0A4Y7QDH5_9AGAM|nr:hypothetical protein BD410DRAFT_826474 [Rickenella mellea]
MSGQLERIYEVEERIQQNPVIGIYRKKPPPANYGINVRQDQNTTGMFASHITLEQAVIEGGAWRGIAQVCNIDFRTVTFSAQVRVNFELFQMPAWLYGFYTPANALCPASLVRTLLSLIIVSQARTLIATRCYLAIPHTSLHSQLPRMAIRIDEIKFVG